jgi:hypothetical protein
LVNTATSKCMPAVRPSTRPIDETSIASARAPASHSLASSPASSTASGVV